MFDKFESRCDSWKQQLNATKEHESIKSRQMHHSCRLFATVYCRLLCGYIPTTNPKRMPNVECETSILTDKHVRKKIISSYKNSRISFFPGNNSFDQD